MKYCRLEDIKNEDFFNEHGRKMLAELEKELEPLVEKWMEKKLGGDWPEDSDPC